MSPAGPTPPSNPGSGRWPSPFAVPSPSHGDANDRIAWAQLTKLLRRILPELAPAVPGYQLFLNYRGSKVATGDYHDFFRRSDGQMAAFLGDGSGHGPATCMLTAIMRTILHTHDVHHEAGETLKRAGGMFHRLIPSDLFMTGVYLVLGPSGRVSWAAAGHHPPLWVNRRGTVAPFDLSPVGSVLGLEPEDYATVSWDMDVGDRLLLFTDGLWEARSQHGETFGRKRLTEHFAEGLDRPLPDLVNGLVARVTAHIHGAEFEDDFTILGIERTG